MIRYHHSKDGNTSNDHYPAPISRTVRYKKFTKPLLERKRRARMNRCLDELKLLVGTLEAEGENINKLEKADILELTVRYIKRISRLQQDPAVEEAHRFQAGFSQCASEACNFLLSLPGLNSAVGHRLVDHLKQFIVKPRPIAPQQDARQRLPAILLNVENSSHLTESSSSPAPNSPHSNCCKQFLSYTYTYNQSSNISLRRMSHQLNVFLGGGDKNTCNGSNQSESINSMWRPW